MEKVVRDDVSDTLEFEISYIWCKQWFFECKLPFKFTSCLVEKVPAMILAPTHQLISHCTHSFLFVVKMPSLSVHFHLFLTRWTLS
jgi:hypothetical protein